ncbi:MAG: glycosyltransferase, partial [Gammaproteobacteria bacterium]|nr:glycosyltransferase [Gammaproteobacteria bacterium]
MRATNVAAGEPLRVAVLGVLAPHKGAHVVAACAKLSKQQDKPIEFHVIGSSQIPLPSAPEALLFETGSYAEGEAGKILDEVKPHLIWFPAQWPETYSYTLSEALVARLPVVVPEIGAFSERLQGRPWTWTLNWNTDPDDILSFFERIRREHFLTATAPPVSEAVSRETSNFYKDEFLDSSEPEGPIDLRSADKLSVVAVLQESLTRSPGVIAGSPDACGYIRGLLPLKELAASGELEFVVVEEDEVSDYVADLFFTQRTAIGSADQANNIVTHCQKAGMKIVYDIDDDLFSLDAGHSEYVNYQNILAGAFQLLIQADLVFVSTNQLKSHLEKWNEHIEVVENTLDDEIWELDGAEPRISRGTRSDPVRILYMGTMTHGADIQLIEDPVRRLCEEFGSRVEFEVVGVEIPGKLPDWCSRVEVSPEISESYPAFVNWLQSENRWHIGVAPLVDSKFNRAKSGIKYLDYAALGLAVACSDIQGYRDIIRSEDDGLLVESTEEAWYEALRRLILDNEFRRRLQENATQNLRRKYPLNSVFNTRLSSLKSLLRRKDASMSGWRRFFGDRPEREPTRESIAKLFLTGQGLEIGALQNPLAVPDGVSVKYVDRFPKDKLYEHYPELL